jgi:transcriptional regulator with XRE-family HTH domain
MKPVSARQEWVIEGICEAVKKARMSYTRRTGKSVISICKEIGVARSYWYQVERGELRTISLDFLKAVEKLFGVELYKVTLTHDKEILVEVVDNDNR